MLIVLNTIEHGRVAVRACDIALIGPEPDNDAQTAVAVICSTDIVRDIVIDQPLDAFLDALGAVIEVARLTP